MSACILWIDSVRAELFKISAQGVEKKAMHQHGSASTGEHHDAHKHNAEEHFFHEVALQIGKVEELLVFGSGPAKTHFKTHLEKHHHHDLAAHLVGVEPLEHMSDNQILEAGRKFFKKFNTYKSLLS